MAGAVELEKLVVRILADASQYEMVMNKLERKITNTATKITQTGKRMSMAITAPIALVGGLAVREYAKFDKAMIQSTSIMGDLSDEMVQDMREVALGIKGIQAPDELAESYYFLASAGLDAKQSMDALPAVAAFATAGAFDMALATDLLTDAQTALGMASKDPVENLENMVQISDALVLAAKQSNASVQQFSESLTNDAAAAAKEYGLELSSTLAILDAYASKGKKGAEAGSLLGRSTRLLKKAYMDNGAAFQEMGIEVIDKATGEYRDFIDVIADMEVAFKDMNGPQKTVALDTLGFAALAQKSITPLLGMSGAMKEWKKAQEDAIGGGLTGEVATKQMQSFSNQFKLLKNNIVKVGIQIGQIVAPYLLMVNNYIQQGLDWWNKLDQATKEWIVGLAGVMAAAGPVLVLLGTLAAGAAGLVAAAGTVVTVLSGLVGALPYIAAVVAAVLGLGVAIGPEGMAGMWDYAWQAVTKFAGLAWGFLANLQHNWKALTSWLLDNWMALMGDLVQLLALSVVNNLRNMLTLVKTVMRIWVAWQGWMAGMWMRVFTKDFWAAVLKGLKIVGKAIAQFAMSIGKAIWAGLTGGAVDMDGFFSGLAGDFKAGMDNANFIETAGGILADGMGDIVLPFDGFESSVQAGPDFKFATEGAAVVKKAAKAGEAVGKAAGQAAVEATQAETEDMLTVQLEDPAIAAKRDADAMALKQRGLALSKQLLTPTERYHAKLKDINHLLKNNAITQDTADRASKAAKVAMEKALKAMDPKVEVKAELVWGSKGLEAGSVEEEAALRAYRAIQGVGGAAAAGGPGGGQAGNFKPVAGQIEAIAKNKRTHEDKVEGYLSRIATSNEEALSPGQQREDNRIHIANFTEAP